MKAHFKKLSSLLVVLVLLFIIVFVKHVNRGSVNKPSIAAPSVSLSVSGNQLLNGSGVPVHLYGMNLGMLADACVNKNKSPSVYPVAIDQSFVNNILAWHVNAVRVLLNEDCWLGLNGISPTASGTAYQNFIENATNLFNANGIAVIITLSKALPGDQLTGNGSTDNTGPLPDSDHSLDFWSSVVSTFKDDPGVIFDAYGEPQNISWSCWLNGCTVTSPEGGTYQGIGMQELVNKIRKDGATQPIMLGGVDYSSDLSGWLANEPTDPLHSLIADFHNYPKVSCNNVACWNSVIPPIASQVPFIDGEFGEPDCSGDYINSYLPWADAHGVSYLGWQWEPLGDCSDTIMNTNYQGTSPTAQGVAYQAHLDSLYSQGLISDLGGSPESGGSPPPNTGGGGGNTNSPPSNNVNSSSNGSSPTTSIINGSGSANAPTPIIGKSNNKTNITRPKIIAQKHNIAAKLVSISFIPIGMGIIAWVFLIKGYVFSFNKRKPYFKIYKVNSILPEQIKTPFNNAVDETSESVIKPDKHI